MASSSFRIIFATIVTAGILIAGGAFIWWDTYRGGGAVERSAEVAPIVVDVSAIIEVAQSPVYARLNAVAFKVDPKTLGNPNPFPGVREEAGRGR